MCLRCADGHLFGTFVVLLVCAGNVPEGTSSACLLCCTVDTFGLVPGMCRPALVWHIRHLSARAGNVPRRTSIGYIRYLVVHVFIV